VLKITKTSEKTIEIEQNEKNLKIITNFVSVHGNCFTSMDNRALWTHETGDILLYMYSYKHHAKLQKENLKKNDYDPSCRNLFYKITSNEFSVKYNVKLKVIKFCFLLVFEYAIILQCGVTI